MSTKIQFKICGETFEISPKYRYNDHLIIGEKEVASLTKQYVKKKYPNIKVWVKSESYSGGCSTNIWMCNQDASKVPDEIYKDIENFAESFQQGNFNGMEDIYEHTNGNGITDDGLRFQNYTKYVFVNNRPKNGSVEDLKLGLIKMMEGGYEFGPLNLEDSMGKFIRWGYDKTSVQKAALLVV